MTGTGTIQVRVAAAKATDAVYASAASSSADNAVLFDPNAPVVTGIARLDATPTNASSVC